MMMLVDLVIQEGLRHLAGRHGPRVGTVRRTDPVHMGQRRSHDGSDVLVFRHPKQQRAGALTVQAREVVGKGLG